MILINQTLIQLPDIDTIILSHQNRYFSSSCFDKNENLRYIAECRPELGTIRKCRITFLNTGTSEDQKRSKNGKDFVTPFKFLLQYSRSQYSLLVTQRIASDYSRQAILHTSLRMHRSYWFNVFVREKAPIWLRTAIVCAGRLLFLTRTCC